MPAKTSTQRMLPGWGYNLIVYFVRLQLLTVNTDTDKRKTPNDVQLLTTDLSSQAVIV